MPFIPEEAGRGAHYGMPLYNVHCTPTFRHLCYKSHVLGDSVLLLRNFRKTEKSPVIVCPTGIESETPCPAVALAILLKPYLAYCLCIS
ncbi:hypothetical protein SFRURICE_018009 [Spodoptera frugiperda]|nr:hypothetical protein SFRURICE_018009 [Spodoptera frugiperda]